MFTYTCIEDPFFTYIEAHLRIHCLHPCMTEWSPGRQFLSYIVTKKVSNIFSVFTKQFKIIKMLTVKQDVGLLEENLTVLQDVGLL